MDDVSRTWWHHRTALATALMLSTALGIRHRVIREDGDDPCGPYRWRIVPTEVAEPCS